MIVVIIVLAVAAGYAVGRIRPIQKGQDYSWRKAVLGANPTKSQIIAFLVLNPINTFRAAKKSIAQRNGTYEESQRPPAPEIGERWRNKPNAA